MIRSFGNKLTEDLYDDKLSKEVRKFPQQLRRIARRKLLYLHEACKLKDLGVPPGNRLETLKNKFLGFHSIRVNDQWRLVFRWKAGEAFDVQIIDYH